MSKTVEVRLWGTSVGYLGYSPGQKEVATFEYTPQFLNTGVQISPYQMKYPPSRFRFEHISKRTFKGVAGVFADSLPDKFGNQLIDLYMADKKIPPQNITTLDRLLYVGKRGMGALEYHPEAIESDEDRPKIALDLSSLAQLSEIVLNRSKDLNQKLQEVKKIEDAMSIIQVSSSAGGARAKAVVARDKSGLFYDGTQIYDSSFGYWLLKFDTDANSDRDSNDPKGMTKVEYIYSKIAKKCAIAIPNIDYVLDGDSFHFMIERFDRVEGRGKIEKLHYASWAGLAHADRDATGTYSYEQLVLLMRELNMSQAEITELFKRAVFNIVGRNQDDHTKNFGFLMDKSGAWSFAPAFDMTYSFDPMGKWTKTHQIKLNQKQGDFALGDLMKFGEFCNIKSSTCRDIIFSTIDNFNDFAKMATELEVSKELTNTIVNGIEKCTQNLLSNKRQK